MRSAWMLVLARLIGRAHLPSSNAPYTTTAEDLGAMHDRIFLVEAGDAMMR